VNVSSKEATFFFDETINDRGTDAQDVTNMFLVSPSDGTPRVDYHRSRIDVRPRNGFRPNTAYTITLLPGLTDLRSNTMKTGATIVFSTGPTISTLRITGIAFDWGSEQPLVRALIEAITPDSVVYLAQSDSGGRFSVGPVNPGSYLVRATIDQNQNHRADRGEAFDTVRVNAPQTAPVELLAALRDTLPARIVAVSVADSVSLRVVFDRMLDPSQRFPAGQLSSGGRGQRADSDHRGAHAARGRRADARPGPGGCRLGTPRRLARGSSAAAGPATSTLRLDGEAEPARALHDTHARAAASARTQHSYRLSVTTVKALSGRETSSERSFVTPRAAPPRPAADTTARPGAARPTRP
jgi:hypothetical protein